MYPSRSQTFVAPRRWAIDESGRQFRSVERKAVALSGIRQKACFLHAEPSIPIACDEIVDAVANRPWNDPQQFQPAPRCLHMVKQRQAGIRSYQCDAVSDYDICFLQIVLIETVLCGYRQPDRRPSTDEMEPGIDFISQQEAHPPATQDTACVENY